jgi:hypothetical protein
MRHVYQILVPVADNSGRDWPIAHHRAWDKRVSDLSGGLVLCPVLSGRYHEINEKVIPVQVACELATLFDILSITKAHYEQEQVMAWKISDEVWVL